MNALDKMYEYYIERESYWNPNDHVLLAVSGGVDSMVLAHLMVHLPKRMRPKLSVAHVNHKLREEADDEEKFIQEWAKTQKLPFYSCTWEQESHPETGIEEAAREFRYAFFRKTMIKSEATILLTAHHLDDQAETVLMRLVRGGTLDQLRGILPVRKFGNGKIIRPLLNFAKASLYFYADEQNVTYYEDESNQSLKYSRNRYRNEIIPLLKKENREVESHLVNYAQDISDILSVAHPIISEKYKILVKNEKSKLKIDHDQLQKESEAVQRLVLLEALKSIYKLSNETFKKTHIQLLLEWMRESPPNSQLSLPGDKIALKEYETTWIKQKESVLEDPSAKSAQLKLNEWVKVTDSEEIGLFQSNSIQAVDGKKIYLDPEKIQLPLTVRHRKNGDRMTLKGLTGTKKIKDIFIDQKIPLKKRNKAWLIEDARGNILWLVGYKESILSITPLTDRISYILAYKKESDFC